MAGGLLPGAAAFARPRIVDRSGHDIIDVINQPAGSGPAAPPPGANAWHGGGGSFPEPAWKSGGGSFPAAKPARTGWSGGGGSFDNGVTPPTSQLGNAAQQRQTLHDNQVVDQLRAGNAGTKANGQLLHDTGDWFNRMFHLDGKPIENKLIPDELDGGRTKAAAAAAQAKSDEIRAKTQAEQRGLSTGYFSTRKLSQAEYDGLSVQQRAAVDANTALNEAVQQDKAETGKADDAYNARVEKMFGKDGGSDTYAPHTLALVEKLGLGNKLHDLDQYLNLSAGVTAGDLPNIASGNKDGVRQANASLFSADATKTLAATLQSGQSLLDTVKGGAVQTGFDPTYQADDGSPSDVLNKFFHSLAVKDNTAVKDRAASLPTYLGELQDQFGIDSQTVYDYLEKRLQQQDYSAAAGTAAPANYMSPAEFRSTYYTGGK